MKAKRIAILESRLGQSTLVASIGPVASTALRELGALLSSLEKALSG